jgi:hypothetical protein
MIELGSVVAKDDFLGIHSSPKDRAEALERLGSFAAARAAASSKNPLAQLAQEGVTVRFTYNGWNENDNLHITVPFAEYCKPCASGGDSCAQDAVDADQAPTTDSLSLEFQAGFAETLDACALTPEKTVTIAVLNDQDWMSESCRCRHVASSLA